VNESLKEKIVDAWESIRFFGIVVLGLTALGLIFFAVA
jgi:hypothetical protein